MKKLLLLTSLMLSVQTSYAAGLSPALGNDRVQNKKPTLQNIESGKRTRNTTPIDTIVAVVNHDIITRQELDQRLTTVIRQLNKQGTPLPPPEVLEKQLLERMIIDMLQIQYASENGIRVDESQLDLAITRIAQQNNFPTLSEFRARLESDGVEFKKFREEIRNEMVSARLREREIESKLIISEAEVDNYLSNKTRNAQAGEEYNLAHIQVNIPEQANAEKIQAAKRKAEAALEQLQNGADFAQVAAGTSDAKDALKGGMLGWRGTDRIPPAFLADITSLQPGQTTAVMRSPNAFHIIKLLEKRSGNAPIVVTQTRTRHILIKTSETVSADEAKKRLMEIKQRIDSGADFAEQAKLYSQDGSAQQGGDLDWASPGQFVPEFEAEMNRLKPGEIGAVQSQFGWHLIQVMERRNADVSEQEKRKQARIAIGTTKSEEQYQDWIRQLRDRSFVEYRIKMDD